MDNNKIQQEHYCLQVKEMCDLLRTRIIQIENFPNKKAYCNKLKKIKYIANEIYWSI